MLQYGSEVWATSVESRRRMGVMKIKYMRTMCGIIIRYKYVEVIRSYGEDGRRVVKRVYMVKVEGSRG
jgi:hypothetical protein